MKDRMTRFMALLKDLWLTRCSRPRADRRVYRTIWRQRPQRILEIGVGLGVRSQRMLAMAAGRRGKPVGYVGIDRFEDRSGGAGLSLKAAYCCLNKLGQRVRLVPGETEQALARTANSLGQFDLVVIGLQPAATAWDRIWFYLPRLVQADTVILREAAATETQEAHFQPILGSELWQLAQTGQRLGHPRPRRRAA